MAREDRSHTTHVNGTGHSPSIPSGEVEMEPEHFVAVQEAIEERDRAMRQAEIAVQEAKVVALKAHDKCESVLAGIRRKYPTFSSRVNYMPDEPRHTWVPLPSQQTQNAVMKTQ